MVWSVMPPSVWFSPDKPLRFAAVACLVLAMSAALAWLQNRLWASTKLQQPSHAAATKMQQPPLAAPKPDNIDLHAHAGLPAT